MAATVGAPSRSAARPACCTKRLAEMKKFCCITCSGPQRARRRDHVAEPEAGHRVALREAVQHEDVVAEAEGRHDLGSVVDEPVVDLVRDDRHAQRGELGERLPALDRAGRIRRGIHDDRARARPERTPYRARVELVTVLRRAGDQHRGSAAGADEVRVAGIVGGAEHHLVSRRDQQREDQQHRRRGSTRDEHAFGIDGHAGAAGVIPRDRLAQLREATAVGVARLAVLQRADAGLDGGRGRWEIGLADLEMDDVRAVTFHREGALHHLHREERLGAARRAPRNPSARVSGSRAAMGASS